MSRRWSVPLFLLIGCTRAASSPSPPAPARAVAPVSSTSTDAGAVIAAVDAAVHDVVGCRLPKPIDTIDDGKGKLDEYGSMVLENVRVLAEGEETFVSWTRRAEHTVGDSWREPHGAVRRGPSSFRQVDLPVLSYACATYGMAALNTIERPYVAWGVLNTTSYELWKDIPGTKVAKDQMMPTVAPPADRTIDTPRRSVDVFVASRDVALALVSEGPCDSFCTCSSGPWTPALVTHSLDPKHPVSARIVRAASDKDADKIDVPALAMGESLGIAAYRVKSALWIVWLDPLGKPLGAPIELDRGEVGAPAVGMNDGHATIVWAKRASKDAPYQLQALVAASQAPLGKPVTIPTGGASAFAPAVLMGERDVVVAWMQGDGGKRGEIHVGRALDLDKMTSIVISGDETNARDPELSGTAAEPTIVWSSFTPERAAGVIRVAKTTCEAPRELPR